MLELNELVVMAEAARVGVSSVERDYVMSHVVASIANQPMSEHLEFKGGTSLRLCHFMEYRYSADIDLNLTHGVDITAAMEGIDQALTETRDLLAIPHLVLSRADRQIEFVGPRGQQRPEKIKLDVSEDELIDGTGNRVPVIQRYDDQIPTPGLPTYSVTEVASEKLRCMVQRLQCRDVYDLHRLLCDEVVAVDTVWQRFEEKARHKNIDPAEFWNRLDTRMGQYKDRWDDDMSGYVADYPDFDRLERELRRTLRTAVR